MGLSVYAKATATGWQKITCEHCGQKFAYPITRTQTGAADVDLFGGGFGAAREQAKQVAESSARNALRYQFDEVPCIGCGRYQPEMVERMAKRKYRLLGVAVPFAILLLTLIPTFAAVAVFREPRADSPPGWFDRWGWLVALALSPLAIWVIRTHRRRVREFDPHDGQDPREWIPVARRRGVVTIEEYRRLRAAVSQNTEPSNPVPDQSPTALPPPASGAQ